MKKQLAIVLSGLMVVTMALAGCGSASLPTSTSLNRSSATDISSKDALAIRSINALPEIDDLDIDETGLSYDDLTDLSVAGISEIWRQKTRIGVIRSVEDGEFYLATHTGFIFKKDVDLPLAPASEKKALKLAKYLNKKVLVRGELSGGKMTAELIAMVPDLSVITDILSKGRVGGKVYDYSTKSVIADASLKLTSVETRKIYRATSSKSGKYSFTRLEAGNYIVEATKAGYSKYSMTLTVAKRKKTEQEIALTNSSTPAMAPIQ